MLLVMLIFMLLFRRAMPLLAPVLILAALFLIPAENKISFTVGNIFHEMIYLLLLCSLLDEELLCSCLLFSSRCLILSLSERSRSLSRDLSLSLLSLSFFSLLCLSEEWCSLDLSLSLERSLSRLLSLSLRSLSLELLWCFSCVRINRNF